MLAENQYMCYIENELADDGYQNCTLKDVLHVINTFIARYVRRWFEWSTIGTSTPGLTTVFFPF
jgi:hypothetical protein